MIGFGTGPLKRMGAINDAFFILNPNDSGLAYVLQPETIGKFITFDWFKKYIICEEHDWVCVSFPTDIDY